MWEALRRLVEELDVFLPPRFSKTLAIALCAIAASGEALALVHGSELREALLDRIFLALLAVLSIICFAVAGKYIKNGFRTKTLYMFTLALAAIGFLSAREAYLRRNLVYSSVGYYRDSTWQLEKQTNDRMSLQLHVEATKDEISAL